MQFVIGRVTKIKKIKNQTIQVKQKVWVFKIVKNQQKFTVAALNQELRSAVQNHAYDVVTIATVPDIHNKKSVVNEKKSSVANNKLK